MPSNVRFHIVTMIARCCPTFRTIYPSDTARMAVIDDVLGLHEDDYAVQHRLPRPLVSTAEAGLCAVSALSSLAVEPTSRVFFSRECAGKSSWRSIGHDAAARVQPAAQYTSVMVAVAESAMVAVALG